MGRLLIGVLTPSSNTVLEPLTSAILADLPGASAHFSRFRVTTISAAEESTAQFDLSAQLAAADLLADAEVASIVWSGTSASWLGFERDAEMCRQITARTGIPAHSAVLATNHIFQDLGVRKIGLVTPYVTEIQDQIVANYADHGIPCVAERHCGRSHNFSFSEVTEAEIEDMLREVAAAKPDAISVMCTNMRGARIAPRLERELGIPIVDSTSAAVWGGLVAAGADPLPLRAWGRLFEVAA